MSLFYVYDTQRRQFLKWSSLRRKDGKPQRLSTGWCDSLAAALIYKNPHCAKRMALRVNKYLGGANAIAVDDGIAKAIVLAEEGRREALAWK